VVAVVIIGCLKFAERKRDKNNKEKEDSTDAAS